MTSGGVRSKTLGKDLTIVFGGFFFPLFNKPLIIGHTSLADYLSVSNNIRPVIVKLHHDYLLQGEGSF
jgi:hypothetical protein